MKELNNSEVAEVSGGLSITQWMDQIQQAFSMLPGVYDTAVTATADCICRATGNC
jgi:hypothetical protein